MNDVQLFIAAGLPTLTVLIGILLNMRSIADLDKRIDSLDKRIDGLDKRIDSLEQRMEARFDRLEARVDRIEADMREFYRVMGIHEARLDNIEKRIA